MNVQQFHAAIDNIIDRSDAKQTSCCSKCTYAYCCYEPLYADIEEVKAMVEALTPEQLQHVKEATAEWVRKAIGSHLLAEKEPNAMLWRREEIACPFLKDRRCMVYDRRPIGCRMYFARGEPEGCALAKREHQDIAFFPPEKTAPVFEPWFRRRVSDKAFEMDHLGVLLAKVLFNVHIHSASKITQASLTADGESPDFACGQKDYKEFPENRGPSEARATSKDSPLRF